LAGSTALDFPASIGTPLWVSAADCSSGTPNEVHCAWTFADVSLPTGAGGLGLVAGYASDNYANASYDLADPNWPGIGTSLSPAAGTAVATSLDLESAGGLFAVSWIQVTTSQHGIFLPARHTVAAADLAGAVAAEGNQSRVVTAISADAGQLTYLSYGWSADPDTLYDTAVSIAAPADAPASAAGLAAQGYIITAAGLADNAGDVVLIGTRVQGDSMARPFKTAQASSVATLMQEGYATVGGILDAAQAGDVTYLGER
jgi:hypothetical protein